MFLGRMNKVKNLTLTIDTIKQLRSRGLNVSLDLYGPDGGMLKTVQQYIEQNQFGAFIKYKGEVNADQKAAAFNEHHFLIQLSSHEGMAMSVLTAVKKLLPSSGRLVANMWWTHSPNARNAVAMSESTIAE